LKWDSLENTVSKKSKRQIKIHTKLSHLISFCLTAIESLETVASNRVDVAMEYALAHPPSSPATLAQRRAVREERRRRQEQLAAAVSSQAEASDVQDQNAQADVNDSNEGANDANDEQKEAEESKPKGPTEEETRANKEKLIEERDAARAKDYLDSVKGDIPTLCLNIIESGRAAENFQNEMESVGNLDDGTGGGDSDTEDVTVVVASFLIDLCTRFPADSTNISTTLIRRLKSNLRVKSRSHCQVKLGCEVNFS
jgi:membrane-associated HD superfamily phosphohydrolase